MAEDEVCDVVDAFFVRDPHPILYRGVFCERVSCDPRLWPVSHSLYRSAARQYGWHGDCRAVVKETAVVWYTICARSTPLHQLPQGRGEEKTHGLGDVTCLMLLALLQREQRLLLRCRQEVLPHLVGPVPHPHLPLLR